MLNQRILTSIGDPTYKVSIHDIVESTTYDITMPSTIRAGDIAVLLCIAALTGTTAHPTVATTAGFTSQALDDISVATSPATYRLATKVLAGTEGGSSVRIFGNQTGTYTTTLMILRHPLNFISVTAGTGVDNESDSTGQSLAYAANLETPPFLTVSVAAMERTAATETLTVSESVLVHDYERVIEGSASHNAEAMRIYLSNAVSAADTMSSAITTGNEYNFLNVIALQLGVTS